MVENSSWELLNPIINCEAETNYELVPFRDRQAGKFSKVPLSATKYFPAKARLLNMLIHLNTMEPPDKPGGWYKMKTGRCTDFYLRDKDVRFRALGSLEADGIIEVERQNGKSPYVRFTASVAQDVLVTGSPSKFKNL